MSTWAEIASGNEAVDGQTFVVIVKPRRYFGSFR